MRDSIVIDFAVRELSGRDDELASLTQVFQRSSRRSSTEFVMVRGVEGSGKTSLIDAFTDSLTVADCIFCKGSFEEANDASRPFSAIIECVESLLEDLMQQHPRSGQEFKRELGLETRVLSKHSNSARGIVGVEQGSGRGSFGTNSDSFRAQWGFERLQVAIRSVTRTVCSHFPVVFVLEDLQWVDAESVRLLRTLFAGRYEKRFMFVGTCQVSGNYNSAVRSLIAQMPPRRLTTIQLNELSIDAVNDMTSRLLRRDPDEVKSLSTVIHRKTGGNCFFAMQFMRILGEKDLIAVSTNTFQWEWDLDRIVAETEVADNVVVMVSGKIKALPSRVHLALTRAACLGPSHFDAFILLRILQEPESADALETKEGAIEVTGLAELEEDLVVAVREGLLENLCTPRMYKFCHDRIKSIAYSLLPKGDEKQRLHLHIGRTLRCIVADGTLTEGDAASGDRLVLLSVRHMNLGSDSIQDSDEKLEIAKLNLQAAEIAFNLSSFVPASAYLEAGLDLLDKDSRWDDQYALTLQLLSTLAHVQLCCGNHDASKATADEVLAHARRLEDKLSVYRSSILRLWQQEEQEQALETTLCVLDELSVHIPRHLRRCHIVTGVFWMQRKLRRLTDSDLLALGDIEDDNIIAGRAFLALLGEIASVSGNKGYQVLAVVHSVSIMTTHGHYRASGLQLALVGFLLMHVAGNADSALRYATLALQMADKGNDLSEDSKTMIICYCFVMHWKKPLGDCIEPVLKALNMAMDVGDVQYTFFAIATYTDLYFHCGLGLEPIMEDMVRFVEVLDGCGQSLFLNFYRPRAQLVLNLMGESDNPTVLTGSMMNQDECLAAWSKTGNLRALHTLNACRMVLAYYFGDLKLAGEMSAKLTSPAQSGRIPWLAPRVFFQGMVAFALYKSSRKRRYRWQGKRFLQRLESFFDEGNINCGHTVLLLRAEAKSVDKSSSTSDVQRAYDSAVRLAGKSGFKHNQALGNERAGIFFLEHDDAMWATTYLTRAWELYTRWGALAKARQLQNKFGEFIERIGLADSKSVSVRLKSRTRLDHVSRQRTLSLRLDDI